MAPDAPAPTVQQQKEQEGSDAHTCLETVICSSAKAERLLSHVKSATLVVDAPHVKVWRVVSEQGTPYAIKWWNPDRVESSAEQCAAEMRAALLLKRMLGEHWPCMSLIAASDADMARGGCTISVYAGDSLDTHNCCSGLCLELREQKAQQLAATMLMAQEVYEKVPEVSGGAMVNRDMKLANTCHRVLPSGRGLFTIINHGGMCFASGSNYFGILDQRYIDQHMASAYGIDGCPAADSPEGIRARMHPTIDKYSTGLAVLELMYGRLPAAVDIYCYSQCGPEQWFQYLEAIDEFDWASCDEVAALPVEMQEWLLWMLARNLRVTRRAGRSRQ